MDQRLAALHDLFNGGVGGQVRLDAVPDHVADPLHLRLGVFHACDAAVPRNADKNLAAVRVGKGDDLLFEIGIDLFL